MALDRSQGHTGTVRQRAREAYRCELPSALQPYAQRVPARAGCLIVWDQWTAHGSLPNASSRPRAIQFLKMFPRSLVATDERLLRRARALHVQVEKAQRQGFRLTELGTKVFGLDRLAKKRVPK